MGAASKCYSPEFLEGFKKIVFTIDPSELQSDIQIPLFESQADRVFVFIPDADNYSRSEPRFNFVDFPRRGSFVNYSDFVPRPYVKDGADIGVTTYTDFYRSRAESFELQLEIVLDIIGLNSREVFSIPNFGGLGMRRNLYLEPGKYLDNEILNKGCFETELTSFVVSFLDKGKSCIDVGGNIGYYSLLFCELASKVLIFEPMNDFREILQKNLYLNNYKNYLLLDVGLSDSRGTHEIYQGECSGTLHWIANHEPTKVESISLFPLDDLDLGREKYDLLKIDVDGHDFKVLKGAEKFIDNQRPTVLFELAMINHASAETSLAEVYSFFSSKNYSLFREDDIQRKISSKGDFITKADVYERSWNFIAMPN